MFKFYLYVCFHFSLSYSGKSSNYWVICNSRVFVVFVILKGGTPLCVEDKINAGALPRNSQCCGVGLKVRVWRHCSGATRSASVQPRGH